MTPTLESAFERLKTLAFPEFAENDALADWQAELSELDGHIAGIATTILAGGAGDTAMTKKQVDQLRLGLEAMRQIGPEDQDVLRACRIYLDGLEEVVKNMIR